jgi:hypothetical protein
LTGPTSLCIPVGVIVERRRALSPWLEAIFRPVSVLCGVPTAAPWTTIDTNGDSTTLYAGEAVVELFRTDTAQYQGNLASGKPSLWVVLRPVAAENPYSVLVVTADPSLGECLTGAGNDLVEAVPMPPSVIETVARFIAQNPPSGSFYKRERDRSGSGHRDAGAVSLKGRARGHD